MLGQEDNEGRRHVISFGGRGLRPCERKWPVTQLECLALLTGIKEYHVYLASRPFTVHTDNLSLKYLQSLKVSANNRLARWALALQPYKFEINYKEGKKLTASDGVSRRPFPEPLFTEDDDDEIAEDSVIAQIDSNVFDSVTDVDKEDKQQKKEHTVITFEYDSTLEPVKSLEDRETSVNEIVDIIDGYDMSELQHQCPDFIPIFDYIENGTLPEDNKAARKLIFESKQFVIDDGILYHILLYAY